MEKRTYYLDRKLSCGDVLDYAAEFFRLHLKDLIVMTLFFHLPVMLVTNYLSSASLLSSMMGLEFSEYQAEQTVYISLIYLLLFYVGVMLSSVYSVTIFRVLQIGVIKYTYEGISNEERIRPKKAIGFGFRKFGWLILFELLTAAVMYGVLIAFYVTTFIGIMIVGFSVQEVSATVAAVFVILIIAAVLVFLCVILYLSVRLSFVPHAIAIDDCNTFSAIKRSFRLTKKRFWRTAKPLFFSAVLLSMAQNAVGAVFSTLAITGGLAFRIVESVIGGLTSFLAPIPFIIGTVMFVHYKTQDGDIAFEHTMRETGEALERKRLQQQALLAEAENTAAAAGIPAGGTEV